MTTRAYQIQKSKLQTARENAKKAMTFATQLAKNKFSESWKECLQTAWNEIKANPSKYVYISFEKVCGKVAKRVILSANWSSRYEVKGTGRPLKENQRLYLDAAKTLCEMDYVTGSYFTDSVIEKF